jgi:tetratricopeptide (TPR) repeat protein
MSSSLLADANEALVDERFDAALRLFTAALATQTTATVLLRRATCSEKLGRFAHAVEDADAAIALEPNNDKAHMRRALALFAAGEYGSALGSFAAAQRLQPSAAVDSWLVQCKEKAATMELTS